jgi:hypothetical protein
VDNIYNVIDHKQLEKLMASDFAVKRYESLQNALRILNDAHDTEFIALAPFPNILRDLRGAFESAGHYDAALIVAIVLAFLVHPIEFPEPWHPVRVSNLQKLGEILGTIINNPRQCSWSKLLVAVPFAVVSGLEILPAAYAVLRLAADYIPMSHGASSELMETVRSQLSSFEGAIKQLGHKDGVIMVELWEHKRELTRKVAEKYFKQLERFASYEMMYEVVMKV